MTASVRRTLTLCLIARNEAVNLPRLFASVTGLVDEIVLVDTGSVDGTVAAARSVGVKVFEVPWNDDFAAAKNAALGYATGDWILALDADMAVEKGQANLIRHAIESGRSRAYFINIRSPRSDGMTVETVAHPWLFENFSGVRFVGRVHETVLPSLLANGLKPEPTDINVTHFGYASETDLRARAERDLRLLALDGDDDPFVVFYRGRAYNRLGRRVEAKQALERVANWKWVDERLQANALALLMRLAAAGTDRLATLQLVRDSTGRFPTDRMTLLTAADVCIQVDDLAQAIACMRQALNSPEYRGQGIGALDRPEPHVRLQLAQCLTCVHKFGEAIEEYRRAVEGGIETVAAFCSWGITYELVHQPQDAEACFQKAIKVDAEVAEPHRRLGLLYAEHGREHEALGELGRALRLGDSTPEIKTTIERLTRQRAFHEQT